ncbi:MAG TPA: CHAT domain-containing tetratricopeptide repeat protein [Pyrinomonadaceae bacterium]|nr:CHAT domain-containing tetratricopeptide repeat protein [Pyrinomonadaceae bacterium]
MSNQDKRPYARWGLLKIAAHLGLALLASGIVFAAPTSPPNILSTVGQGEAREIRQIKVGEVIERELSGGQAHYYEITLDQDQFVHLVTDQQGIDIVMTLFGPDGKQIIEVDSPNGARGPEPIWYVSEAAGTHRLVVRSLDKEAPTGKYQIRLEKLRAAATEDRQRAGAQKNLIQGAQLLSQRTAESSKQAAEKFQSALDLWRASGDRQGEADALGDIGQYYSTIDDSQKALEYYGRARALVLELGDKRRQANILYLIGEEHISSTVERKQKSLSYYQQSLALTREVGDRWGEARALNKIGLVYAFMSETRTAFEYFIPLLALERSLGDLGGTAITLNYIGGLYSWLGDYQKALDYYSQALPLSRSAADGTGERFALRNLGTAYFGLGDYERALSYFEQVNRVNESDRESHGLTLGDIGSVYAKLGDPQKALDYYNQALSIWRQLKAARFESSSLSNIGSIYRDLGDYQKAIDFYNQALPLKRYVGDRRGEAAILINLGKVQLSLLDAHKGLDFYRQAFDISQAVGDQSLQAQALDGMARAQRNLGNLAEARTRIEAALNIIESLRARIVRRELRASYYASVQQYYETYIDLLMRLHQSEPTRGYDAAALQASESARARSLLELLNETRVDIRQGVDPELLEREHSLQEKLNAAAERQAQLLGRKHTDDQATASQKEIDELLSQYNEVEAQIRIKSPGYAALTQPQPLGLREIQEAVLDPDTVLLEYALGDERSYLWVVTSSSIHSFSLPPRKAVETAARHVYDLLTARNRRLKFETVEEKRVRVAKADAEYWQAATTLSRMILEPAIAQLGQKRLLIVGDGALDYVPFAALPAPLLTSGRIGEKQNGQFETAGPFTPLVVEHEIVSLPSASTLAALRRDVAGRRPANKMLAVIADPVFEKDDERVRTAQRVKKRTTQSTKTAGPPADLSRAEVMRSAADFGEVDTGGHLSRLPFTRREANQILRLVRQSDRKQALDFDASKATAMSADLAQYKYVHFATHGFLNSRHPELSGIVLSLVDQQGAEQNGFLRANEIFNLKLPADLVVLSGCRTGLGKEIRREGLLGLTRGFMYAGAARVLVSLWSVSDEASAELMAQVYRGMLGKEHLRPSAALRAAQLAIWKDKRWQPPYYWAAFTLQGEPR